MQASITLHLISSQPLLLQALTCTLSALPRQINIIPLSADGTLQYKLGSATASRTQPNIAVVVVNRLPDDVTLLHMMRSADYDGSILVLLMGHVMPNLDELKDLQVQSIISSLGGVGDLECAIYAMADGKCDCLEQQYFRAYNRMEFLHPLDSLNPREKEILQLAARDLSDKEIASLLQISSRTVGNHLRHIYAKLDVRTRVGAAILAVKYGLTSTEISKW